jgi:hypothetical protein
VGHNNSAETLSHWQSVRRLLDTLPETSENLSERAAVRAHIMIHLSRLGDVEDRAVSLFQEARELATRSGDRHVLSQVLSGFGMIRGNTGACEEALELALEANRRADETQDTDLKVSVSFHKSGPRRVIDSIG